MSYFGGNLRSVLQQTSDIEYYVDCDNGSDLNDGTLAKPFKNVQHAVDQLPKFLNSSYDVNISLLDSTHYSESLNISNFIGGSIDIYSENADATLVVFTTTATAGVGINSCGTVVTLEDITFHNNQSNSACINISNSNNVALKYIEFSMEAGKTTTKGVNTFGMCNVLCYGCADRATYDKVDYGIYLSHGSLVQIDDFFGTDRYYIQSPATISLGGWSGTIYH